MKTNNENKKNNIFFKDKYKFGKNVKNQTQYFTTSFVYEKKHFYESNNTVISFVDIGSIDLFVGFIRSRLV